MNMKIIKWVADVDSCHVNVDETDVKTDFSLTSIANEKNKKKSEKIEI